MTPEEICALLNQHKHDGETDWELHTGGIYFSETQGRRARVPFMPLSPASAEIIASYYLAVDEAEGLKEEIASVFEQNPAKALL